MKIKLRKGDLVEVISGRDKNKRGEIIKVLVEENRVVVQGVNLRKKHQRQTRAGGRTLNPGIIEFEAPIHVSNVMLVCPSCGEPHRVKILRQPDKVVRVCKGCNALVDE